MAPKLPDRDVSGEPSGDALSVGQNFSLGRALEAIGERWSLLVIRDAVFHGTSRFDQFETRLSIAPDILAARLDGFVGAGLMELAASSDEPASTEPEYVLTQKGRNLEPVIIALTTWEDGWDAPPLRAVPIAQPAVVPLRAGKRGEPLPVLTEISLLGAFVLTVGGTVVGPLAVGTQRLLAFLALHDRTVTRTAMAGTMWPDASEERAGISLRSALSRLDRQTHDAILSASAGLSLADAVDVDFRDAQALAHRLLLSSGIGEDGRNTPVPQRDLELAATTALSTELLPDWYDDWVITEAEDWRQLRMSALEAQAGLLLADGRFADSANAARAAMKVEPLRESANACLIRAHLAKGNQSEALRAFDLYTELLWGALGIRPTEQFTELVADLRA